MIKIIQGIMIIGAIVVVVVMIYAALHMMGAVE